MKHFIKILTFVFALPFLIFGFLVGSIVGSFMGGLSLWEKFLYYIQEHN